MTQQELQKILDLIKYVPDEERDETTRVVLKAAADSITLEKLNTLTNGQVAPILEKKTNSDNENSEVKFSAKEISLMPKTFRKEFRTDGCTARVRKKKSGKQTWCYEIRYRRNGYDIAVSSNDLDKAKAKFIEALKTAVKTVDKTVVPTTFHEFAMYFFETFRKRKVKKITYENDLYRYKNHVKPYFESTPLRKITPAQCQALLDDLKAKGYGKTVSEIHSQLNIIFKMAIAHNIIHTNPLNIVVIERHENKHGKALTKDEERLLLSSLSGSRYQLLMAVALYTGMRPNEYKSARIENGFIVAINSKRKNNAVEYKKIPITPMLKPYLKETTSLDFPRLEYMRDKFNSVLSGHRLYDLRTTFYTRCTECGVSEVALKKFVGHTLGKLGDAYTDLSDEYLIAEGNKLNY